MEDSGRKGDRIYDFCVFQGVCPYICVWTKYEELKYIYIHMHM